VRPAVDLVEKALEINRSACAGRSDDKFHERVTGSLRWRGVGLAL
jgi:hypothetical protein